MLKRVRDDDTHHGEDHTVRFVFDGRELTGRAGDSLAAALLANGILQFRDSPVSGAPRGPFCLMGVCFECLVEIDGLANCQACMVPLTEGMTVRCQRGGVEVIGEGGGRDAL
jgi:predicted molibdopterin-dependent oxidoreductase YjgC